MKMKVGDILKDEIQDVPGLHYPCKIKINKNYIYPVPQKLENEIFLENCKTFLNTFHNSKSKSMTRKNRSYSQKKGIKLNQTTTRKSFFKKNSDNYSTKAINKLLENLPIIDNSTPKKTKNVKSNSRKTNHHFLLNECSLLKNKIKKMNNLKSEYNKNKGATFSFSSRKREHKSNFTEGKPINQIRIENLFNANVKNSNNINNKNHNILGYRIKNRIESFNHIINKLNTPIFIYNKTEVN